MQSCHRLALLASLFAAACGSVENKAGHLPDAGDIVMDDAPAAPVRGTVHVTVLEPDGTGNPAVGASVVFVDADGTVTKATSDTAGKASADLLPGANVTSIVLIDTKYTLQTVLALKPGDDVTLGMQPPDAASAGLFTATIPSYGNATNYAVSTPCGQSGAYIPPAGGPYTAQVIFTNNCKKSPFEMVVVALDGTGNAMSSFNVLSVPFLAGSTYAAKGTYTGFQAVTASYTNIDSGITTLRAGRVSPDAWGVLLSSPTVAPTGPTAAVTVNGGLSSTAQMLTTVGKGTSSMQTVRQPVTGTASSYGLDLGATLLPWIGKPTYDVTTTKVIVPVDTTGTTNDKPDLFGVQISYARSNADQTTTSFAWSFFGPDIGDISLPVLPTDLGPLLPTADDKVSVIAAAFDAASLNGYDATRTSTMAEFTSQTSTHPTDSNIRVTRCTVGRASC